MSNFSKYKSQVAHNLPKHVEHENNPQNNPQNYKVQVESLKNHQVRAPQRAASTGCQRPIEASNSLPRCRPPPPADDVDRISASLDLGFVGG